MGEARWRRKKELDSIDLQNESRHLFMTDARRSRFIRADFPVDLGRTRTHACVALCAVALLGCGPSVSPALAREGSAERETGSSGSETSQHRGGDYALVEPGVFSREGVIEGISFLEVVLGATDPTEALPLWVVIHGLGDHPDVPTGPYRDLSRPVRIILPRGPLVHGDGFAWMSVRVGDDQLATLSSELDVQTERLAGFLERLEAERPAQGPAVLIGFSQGGMLTLSLAVRHPALVGIAFPLAGWP